MITSRMPVAILTHSNLIAGGVRNIRAGKQSSAVLNRRKSRLQRLLNHQTATFAI